MQKSLVVEEVRIEHSLLQALAGLEAQTLERIILILNQSFMGIAEEIGVVFLREVSKEVGGDHEDVDLFG